VKLLPHELKIVNQWVTAALTIALEEYLVDVSASQAYILVSLLDMNGAPSQKLLAKSAGIDTMTTHTIIKRLETRGYLVRQSARKIPDSTGRETPVELTPSGREAAGRAKAALTDVDAFIRGKLGCFATGFEDGLGELVDLIRDRPQVE
jgi:DNA-binding MarR family transcriptional regulator